MTFEEIEQALDKAIEEKAKAALIKINQGKTDPDKLKELLLVIYDCIRTQNKAYNILV